MGRYALPVPARAVAYAALLVASPAAVATESGMARIDGGSFTMGSETGLADERPAHRQTVAAFLLDRRPVTNREFADFLDALGRHHDAGGRRLFDIGDNDAEIVLSGGVYRVKPGKDAYPVIEPTWRGALAFCQSRGKRLPTEAEWEYAARGREGRTYPWGEAPPDAGRARYGRSWGDTAPAGSLPRGATPDGVLDLAGNVHEWVSTLARPYPYRANDGREDPEADGERVTRGGAADTGAETLRASWRGASVSRAPGAGHHNIGFRCAADI